jgi:hypothetical protein
MPREHLEPKKHRAGHAPEYEELDGIDRILVHRAGGSAPLFSAPAFTADTWRASEPGQRYLAERARRDAELAPQEGVDNAS